MKDKLFNLAAWLMVPSHYRLVLCIIVLVLMAMAVVLPGARAIADSVPGTGPH